MRPPYAVVGGWASGLAVLAVTFLAFSRSPVALIYFAAILIVAGFGLAVLLATRRGREGTAQRRQPRRATAAAFTALAGGVAATALAYGWIMFVLALYPLAVAAWTVRGERLPAGAQPWPVAADGVRPAGAPRYPHHGQSVGDSVAVPRSHPAHGAPDPPPPPRAPLGRRIGWAMIAGRALLDLLRRRR